MKFLEQFSEGIQERFYKKKFSGNLYKISRLKEAMTFFNMDTLEEFLHNLSEKSPNYLRGLGPFGKRDLF